ncbi:MAG: hypothetical protein KF884_10195 [Fimbriimonadaceae bacterium]|nr:hypothetical protein [Fimbriimonadaceae bacterium]QYK57917.1 MAG: hypothetical protein KF884_10195 [Fimbriimonadaceae bacterium]
MSLKLGSFFAFGIALAGCSDPAPTVLQRETPERRPVPAQLRTKEEDPVARGGKITWDYPGNKEGWENVKRALREDRGKSTALGTVPMARGLVVSDPLSKVKAMFPRGPVAISGGPDGYRAYFFHVKDPEPGVFAVFCIHDEIAIAAEKSFDRETLDQNPLEPYAWSEVPAELARMERDNEANSRPRPAAKPN